MIRKATIYDKDKINELGSLVNDNYENLFDLGEILEEKFSRVYVYEINNNVVGFVHATVLYETIDIINIVVDPKFRRQQIASNLFDYLLSEAPSSVELITLEVSENNEPAINLYKKFGFEIVNIRKKYYKDSDGFLMGRKIR